MPPQAKPGPALTGALSQGPALQGVVHAVEPSAAGRPSGTESRPAAQDPSMEDILASIRRILTEEDDPPARPTPAHAPPVAEDILDLDPGMMVQEQAAMPADATGPTALPHPHVATHDASERDDRAGHEQPPTRQAAPPEGPPEGHVTGPNSGGPAPSETIAQGSFTGPLVTPMALVAPEAAAAAALSLDTLTRTLATERQSAVHRGGPTIEDLVRETLRPLLKDWLDAHLPALVERLVRAEIERVVNRAAG